MYYYLLFHLGANPRFESCVNIELPNRIQKKIEMEIEMEKIKETTPASWANSALS